MKKRVLGICLSLLMLIMTACGGYEDTVSDNSQSYENTAPEVSQSYEGTAPEVSQSYESTAPEVSQSYEGTAPETSQSYESEVQEDTANDNLPVQGEYYYDLVNVVLYLEIYDELPPNYITKSGAQRLGWEGGSVEKYKEGAAIGGDSFGNREGLLPKTDGRSYTECDIDTNGYSSRGSRRLVFSNDGLYFYTSDHYETFSEVTVTEDYEVIW